jgi:hypothetical protein
MPFEERQKGRIIAKCLEDVASELLGHRRVETLHVDAYLEGERPLGPRYGVHYKTVARNNLSNFGNAESIYAFPPSKIFACLPPRIPPPAPSPYAE